MIFPNAIKEKMDLDIQVSRLKLMKANHTSQIYRLEDKGNQTVLHIGSGSHLLRGTNQKTNLSASYLAKQLRLS